MLSPYNVYIFHTAFEMLFDFMFKMKICQEHIFQNAPKNDILFKLT